MKTKKKSDFAIKWESIIALQNAALDVFRADGDVDKFRAAMNAADPDEFVFGPRFC